IDLQWRDIDSPKWVYDFHLNIQTLTQLFTEFLHMRAAATQQDFADLPVDIRGSEVIDRVGDFRDHFGTDLVERGRHGIAIQLGTAVSSLGRLGFLERCAEFTLNGFGIPVPAYRNIPRKHAHSAF